jgi:hypothetical protein
MSVASWDMVANGSIKALTLLRNGFEFLLIDAWQGC